VYRFPSRICCLTSPSSSCFVWNVRGLNGRARRMSLGKFLAQERAMLVCVYRRPMLTCVNYVFRMERARSQCSCASHCRYRVLCPRVGDSCMPLLCRCSWPSRLRKGPKTGTWRVSDSGGGSCWYVECLDRPHIVIMSQNTVV
jgi:hypothetical protein